MICVLNLSSLTVLSIAQILGRASSATYSACWRSESYITMFFFAQFPRQQVSLQRKPHKTFNDLTRVRLIQISKISKSMRVVIIVSVLVQCQCAEKHI